MAKPIVYVTRRLPNEIISELTEKYQVKMWEEEEMPVPRDVLKKEIAEADAVLSMLTVPLMRTFKHGKPVESDCQFSCRF